ncbi:hypothetical protein [Pseudomonas amygdali]|uniref:hypothetical protein n=1 Tax=Pseudomonas amygdali TaxID=47877 RepID=UPI000E3BD989|nr:hypothetical protein [Pseudomonas amygdali]
MELEVEQESLIWSCAAAHYHEYLSSVVSEAVVSYLRKPGLDSLTRIHKQDVGAAAFAVLERVLPRVDGLRTDSSYIHVRQQLRSHVSLHILKRLVDDHAAPAELRDTLFAIDLGL